MGIVYLVGAGPGDPKLITLRGVECLGRADIVLYDYLVNPRLLVHVRAEAEVICLGRHGYTRIWSQDEINQQLITSARNGKVVVRLKSGDPAVFARGAEEAALLAQAEVPFEVVPGITAALAASSCAGIPVTHREFSSAVALVTGQENDEKTGQVLDYRVLAKFPGTLVFYMGVTTAQVWTSQLIDGGMSPETPAAIVRRCSFPDQRTICCRLSEIPTHMTALRPPAIVVIGEVTKLADQLDWFTKRPLFGLRILVTRSSDQSGDLVNELEELGADVLLQPAIEVRQPHHWVEVDAAIRRLNEFAWVVFSSTNGVRFFLKRVFELGLDSRVFAGTKLAAVGFATSELLKDRFGLRADLVPKDFHAEGLLEPLTAHVAGQRMLLIRASRGRDVLKKGLETAGAIVEQVVGYESRDVEQVESTIQKALLDSNIHWVTVTSSAIARSLYKMFGEQLKNCQIASISPITSSTLREMGLQPTVEATEFSMSGLIKAICEAVTPVRNRE